MLIFSKNICNEIGYEEVYYWVEEKRGFGDVI
jgi:hypothetical protein